MAGSKIGHDLSRNTPRNSRNMRHFTMYQELLLRIFKHMILYRCCRLPQSGVAATGFSSEGDVDIKTVTVTGAMTSLLKNN